MMSKANEREVFAVTFVFRRRVNSTTFRLQLPPPELKEDTHRPCCLYIGIPEVRRKSILKEV